MTCNSSTIFLDSFQRLQPEIVPRLTISSNMIFKCEVKKADITFIFFSKMKVDNLSRWEWTGRVWLNQRFSSASARLLWKMLNSWPWLISSMLLYAMVEMTHGQLFCIFQSSLALAEESLSLNYALPSSSSSTPELVGRLLLGLVPLLQPLVAPPSTAGLALLLVMASSTGQSVWGLWGLGHTRTGVLWCEAPCCKGDTLGIPQLLCCEDSVST